MNGIGVANTFFKGRGRYWDSLWLGGGGGFESRRTWKKTFLDIWAKNSMANLASTIDFLTQTPECHPQCPDVMTSVLG